MNYFMYTSHLNCLSCLWRVIPFKINHEIPLPFHTRTSNCCPQIRFCALNCDLQIRFFALNCDLQIRFCALNCDLQIRFSALNCDLQIRFCALNCDLHIRCTIPILSSNSERCFLVVCFANFKLLSTNSVLCTKL